MGVSKCYHSNFDQSFKISLQIPSRFEDINNVHTEFPRSGIFPRSEMYTLSECFAISYTLEFFRNITYGIFACSLELYTRIEIHSLFH